MGIVYLGFRRHRAFAIKVLRPELTSSLAFRKRFGREIAAATRVEATCTAAFVRGDAEADLPYFITEYVPGPTLEEYVAHNGPLTNETLRAFAAGVADALAAIGRAGLVHRDLKPTNVLMTRTGPKVIDFGVAAGDDTVTLTQTGQRVGTPRWMAPEQVNGESVTGATDVFAWGALVAFAGTATAPFGSGNSDAILYRVVHAAPQLGGLDLAIRPLVQRALAKNPKERPAVDDLLHELLEEPNGDTTTSDVAYMLQQAWPHEVLSTSAAVPRVRDLRGFRRRRPLVAFGIIAVTFLAIAGTALAIERRQSESKRPKLAAAQTKRDPTTVSGREPTRPVPQSSHPSTKVPTSTPLRSKAPTSLPTSSPPPFTTLTTVGVAGLPVPAWAAHVVSASGYVPTASTSFSPQDALDAIVATRAAAADAQQRVFFFADGRFVGNDTSDTSPGPQLLDSPFTAANEVVVEYFLYHPADAQCCPTAGAQTVRFVWRNGALAHLDPIPPSGINVDPSRR